MASAKKSSPPPSLSLRERDVAFGKALRRFRLRQVLTQEQLAWAVEMSRVYLSNIERGRKEPCLGTIFKLASALGIPAAELIAETERLLQR